MSRAEEPTVPSVFVPTLVSFALRHGASPERLFASAGLDLAAARQPGSTLSVCELERLIDVLIEQTGLPAFGLLLGAYIDLEHLSLFGQLVVTAATPRHAIAMLSAFKRLLHPSIDLRVEQVGEVAILRYASTDGLSIGERPYYAEALFSAAVVAGRHVVGKEIAPIEVRFRHPRPAYADMYTRVFGCPIKFDQEVDALHGAAELLDAPMLSHCAEHHRLALAQASEALARERPAALLQVRRVIASRLTKDDLSLEDVAHALAMSVRSLQRRLGEHRTSFRRLRDEVRFERARELLACRDISIDEVAETVGYRDRSNFARAFQRWSGQSPSGYRKLRPRWRLA